MTTFSRFAFIARVVEGFARGTPWRVTSATLNKIVLRYGGGVEADEDGNLRRLPSPPFDYAKEWARADLANIPGIKIVVRENGTAIARLGTWIRDPANRV